MFLKSPKNEKKNKHSDEMNKHKLFKRNIPVKRLILFLSNMYFYKREIKLLVVTRYSRKIELTARDAYTIKIYCCSLTFILRTVSITTIDLVNNFII